jgi:hypothetical protein
MTVPPRPKLALLCLVMGLCVASTAACKDGQQPSSACGALSEPTSPWLDPVTLVDRYDGASFSELGDLEVDGQTIWFCSSVIGLNAWDFTTPSNLMLLDRLTPSAGSQQFPRCQHLAVDAAGARVYVTNRESTIARQSFIAVVDSSKPRELEEIGTLLTDDQVEGIAVHGDLLLVAAHGQGLVIYRRGLGADLTELARLSGLGNVWQVRGLGTLAYLADSAGGLVTVDIADPAAPALLHRLELPGAPKDLELDGDRAFVAAGSAGVALVSLADPRAPAVVEIEDTPGSALAVAYGGSSGGLYVADWTDLRIFDASRRDELRLVGHEPLPVGNGRESRTLGVAAAGDLIFSGNWRELVDYRYHPQRTAPDLDVSPRIGQLPTVSLGETASLVLRFANRGNEPLSLRAAEPGDDSLSLSDWPEGAVLAPGEEGRAVLSRTGTGEEFTSWINLVSDDPDEGRRCVPVEADRPGIGLGETAIEASYLDRDGVSVQLSALRSEGPVLLAYFATF